MALSQNKIVSSPETVWVLGYGEFGRRAVELLQKAAPAANIVVVDRQPVRDLSEDIEVVCADGVEWFSEHFNQDSVVNKIVPALPVHLVAEWLKKKLTAEYRTVHSVEIPDNQLHYFPHPIRLSHSRVVMSHADFLCPPNCSEPEKLCTYTKQPRPQALYSLLETVVLKNFTPLIVRSRQFALGVGGFFPEDLWDLFERGRGLPGASLLIGTACKCHGVVDGLKHTMLQSQA
ncbi:MAG: hypothetical protein GY799_30555 [Desulfobulbaceae bacterium]|nr:hypothetical protein [Desulfobulbaceae bacterium]